MIFVTSHTYSSQGPGIHVHIPSYTCPLAPLPVSEGIKTNNRHACYCICVLAA